MTESKLHEWEATGVTGYPITHPIVGQTEFYTRFKHYLQLVGTENNRFAHVFAVVAPWGVGKSRLGYELVAQVNGTSQGWKVRGASGGQEDACLFDDEATREKYLALYLRYSQVAHPSLNLDNWFAPAVYKALAPLARSSFDTSIQHQIARQSAARLNAEGFDPAALASALELGKHTDEAIYPETELATRLCNAAFQVLSGFGIRYVMVVLDELETAAERATAGMEAEEARSMDGKAITMLRRAVETLGRPPGLGRSEVEMVSKAVKEEDARARFPWLRFVVLCSPAIGDELREVQSTDRRFEIMDLTRNAFSDVSTFVRTLAAERRLLRAYPEGLVEAAYMMSGGNFGWFNVIMAVVDQVLAKAPSSEAQIRPVFRRAIEVSNRIGSYVLDHRALDELPGDGALRESAAQLLFGQQPVPASSLAGATALLAARNAHGEPIALPFRRVVWRIQDCTRLLVQNRFVRQGGTARWAAPGIADPVDLERLLDDLATLAVREPQPGGGEWALLLPETQADFLQLLDLVHPHAATEEVGRVLWTGLVASEGASDSATTHIGPSVEMLRRLDIRLRKTSAGTVFRNPDENQAFTASQERTRPVDRERATRLLVGVLRVVDENWTYDAEPAGLGEAVTAIRTPKDKGLVDFKGLWLHPKGLTVFAWARNDQQLRDLCVAVANQQGAEGRYPVLAFTSDFDLPQRFKDSRLPEFVRGRESVVLVHVNSGEEADLVSVGAPTSEWAGFRLRRDGFSTRFAERLNRVKASVARQARDWRHAISADGRIAWPLRPAGPLKPEALSRLLEAWKYVMLERGGVALHGVSAIPGVDYPALLGDLGRLGAGPAAAPKGYGAEDGPRLWVGEDSQARPEVPPLLVALVRRHLWHRKIDQDQFGRAFLWGYTWDNARPSDIFQEWMRIACDLGWAEVSGEAGPGKRVAYALRPKSELKGRVDEATKWLDDRYPAIYRSLREVLGAGRIDQLFKPGEGTKYAKADQRIKEARAALQALDVLEASPPDPEDLAACGTWFVEATRHRRRVIDLVDLVFDKTEYERLGPDLDRPTLALDDEDLPLWKRIRIAEHFANTVTKMAKRIRARLPALAEELRAGVKDITSFPIALFTRPLSKIDNIVDAGLAGENPEATTKREQLARVETLAWYLKELRIADAIRSLRGLAQEACLDPATLADLSIEDAKGALAMGYCDLRERYGAARQALVDLSDRIDVLEEVLLDAPLDFRLPSGVELSQVVGVPDVVSDQLDESLQEDVEDMLTRHDGEMSLGEFGPLAREARARLLDSAEQTIRGLEGKVRTIENAVNGYRQGLLGDPRLALARSALNALHRAAGRPQVHAVELGAIEGVALRRAVEILAGMQARWAAAGEDLLDGTSVSFTRWSEVVQAVASGRDPGLPMTQSEALVVRGYLRRVYALGVGAAG